MNYLSDAEPVRIDHSQRQAYLNGKELPLTPREFQLLVTLVARPHELVATQTLMENLWGTSTVGSDHSIEVYISRLRRKLVDHGASAQLVQTVRGLGYRYSPAVHSSVELTYDRRLILRRVEPADRKFFGWNPEDVINTFFLLTTHRKLSTRRSFAVTMTKALCLAGFTEWSGPMEVRTGDGGHRLANVEIRLITEGRRFLGMRGVVEL